MDAENSLNRFLDAQENSYSAALAEIRAGRKRTHWMWYIFPQIAGLGHSETSRYYAIRDLAEAQRYLAHPVLGKRLVEISTALLQQKDRSAAGIFGSPDDMKLRSSMTLFHILPESHPVFHSVLDQFFNGKQDPLTLSILRNL